MSHFHSLDVVDRGSEPQLQVGEKLQKGLRLSGKINFTCLFIGENASICTAPDGLISTL